MSKELFYFPDVGTLLAHIPGERNLPIYFPVQDQAPGIRRAGLEDEHD